MAILATSGILASLWLWAALVVSKRADKRMGRMVDDE